MKKPRGVSTNKMITLTPLFRKKKKKKKNPQIYFRQPE